MNGVSGSLGNKMAGRECVRVCEKERSVCVGVFLYHDGEALIVDAVVVDGWFEEM